VRESEQHGCGEKPERSGRQWLYNDVEHGWGKEPKHASDNCAKSQTGKDSTQRHVAEQKPACERSTHGTKNSADASDDEIEGWPDQIAHVAHWDDDDG
jgi:hypothetical protein